MHFLVCAISYVLYIPNSRLERQVGGKLTCSLLAIIICMLQLLNFHRSGRKSCFCLASDLSGFVGVGCAINIVSGRRMGGCLAR